MPRLSESQSSICLMEQFDKGFRFEGMPADWGCTMDFRDHAGMLASYDVCAYFKTSFSGCWVSSESPVVWAWLILSKWFLRAVKDLCFCWDLKRLLTRSEDWLCTGLLVAQDELARKFSSCFVSIAVVLFRLVVWLCVWYGVTSAEVRC